MKRIVLILACVAMAGLFVAGPACRAEATYRVDTGGNDNFTGLEAAYRAGDEVTVYFDLIIDDADIGFTLDGQPVSFGYDSEKGYVIRFTMPDHDVKLEVTWENSMTYVPFDEPEPVVNAPGTYASITQEEAARRLEEDADYILLDVRTPEEYAEGHIPGAINLPNESIGGEMPPELPDPAQEILVYCRSGRRSKEAAQKLADMGYTGILEFGGIITWPGEIVK